MTNLTKRTVTVSTTTSNDFGFLDKRGRKIGAIVTRATLDYVPAPEGAYSGYSKAPGTYQGMLVQATRDGKSFGACQSWTSFDTVSEREKAITKYLASAKKRAAKIQ